MSDAFIVRRGGAGGAALNYKVVGGTEAPASAAENTIWVNTSTAISDHVFSIEEPEKVEGRVWFLTGTNSAAVFNALKKNTIMIYPMSCKQVVGGAWIDKTAKTCADGAWVDWTTYLYSKGKTNAALVGEWIGTNNGLTMNESSMTITALTAGGSVYYGALYSEEFIDLTGFSTVQFEVSAMDTGSDGLCSLCIFTETPTGEAGEYWENKLAASKTITSTGVHLLDVSGLTGTYQIGAYLWGRNYHKSTATLTEISMR